MLRKGVLLGVLYLISAAAHAAVTAEPGPLSAPARHLAYGAHSPASYAAMSTHSASDLTAAPGAREALACLALVLLVVGCSSAPRGPRLASAAVLALGSPALSMQAAHAALPSLNVVSHSSSAQSNVPVTFGQTFKAGDVPSGTHVSATGGSGAQLTVQLDGKATHADGSLRHAVVTVLVPSIAANGSQVIQLTNTGSVASGTAVALSDLLATVFDAQVQLNVGGTVYTASARQLLQGATPSAWLSGPLVSEWIVGGPLKTSAGTAHPHLAAYFHVRAYAGNPIDRVRVDVVVENGWTFVVGPAMFSYTANVSVGGASVYTATLNHYHHTRWHRRFWWGADPQSYVQHDTIYLQNTGAVPRYMTLQPSQGYLNSMHQDSVPMSNGDLTQYFPTTGAQDQIGPLPRWTTAYAVSADERAYHNMLANDDSAGSYSIHFRDEATGRPVSIVDHPNVTDQLTAAQGGGLPDPSGGNPNTADDAHQPSIAFVSYLESGDYFYLEELQFWTSWNQLDTTPSNRMGGQGIQVGQVRGQAWTLRNLGQAAYATPDTHPLKTNFVASVGYNLSFNESLYPNNAAANKLGALRSYDGYQNFAPWMDDFYTWSMGYLVDLGFNATSMRNWKAIFPVGRMGTTDYCYLSASAYHLVVGSSDTAWWPDFATLYTQNFGPLTSCPLGGAMIGYPSSATGYPSNLRPALAVAVDSGVAGAGAAWDRLITSSPQPDYSDDANFAVLPRTTAGTGVSLTLSANPTSVSSGQSAALSWVTAGASSCTASGGWTGSQATSGTVTVGPLTSTTSYTLTCTGAGGSATQSVSVAVAPAQPPGGGTSSATATKSGGGAMGLPSILVLLLLCARRAWFAVRVRPLPR